jgi:hypothetical protein
LFIARGKKMATDATIEARLEVVEEAVEELRRKMEVRSTESNWLAQVIGIFRDEPAFDEVIRLGREFRMADRPAEDSGS